MISQNLDARISEAKKTFILLEFTKELIRQSGEEIFELENIIEDEIEDHKEIRRPVLKKKEEKVKKVIYEKSLGDHEKLKMDLESEVFKRKKN